MKKIIFLFLLCGMASFIRAQSLSANDSVLLANAKELANKKNKNYNPTAAVSQFTTLANKGNGQAMNALGILYSNGAGVDIDEKQGFAWFEKSAKAGYVRSWYNLGAMYKAGIGVTQDFNKAYECFENGAKLKDRYSIYAKGYCLYEGLGCKQSYEKAVVQFAKGASMKDLASMYMLGLCFRNGYGIGINTDMARYWLTRAAEGKYRFAINELANPIPENTEVVKSDLNLSNAVYQPKSTGRISSYQKIIHKITGNNLSGSYTGYQLKFDWSGKHIINQSSLTIDLKQTKSNVSGEWAENDNPPVNVNGMLTDTGLIFNNSSYSRKDHFNTKSPNQLEFKNGQLQLTESGDTVYLTGTIQLYSSKQRELDKPTFIMLLKNAGTNGTANNFTITKTDSIHFVAYPNPFVNALNLKYTLKKACNVSIMISRLHDGAIVYKEDSRYLNEGEHTNSLYLTAGPGTYVITLIYGNQLKSALVFKN